LPGSDETDHAVSSLGVNDDERLAIDKPKRNPSQLAIVMPPIQLGNYRSFEYEGGFTQVDISLNEHRPSLVLVPFKFQSRLIYTKVYTFSSN